MDIKVCPQWLLTYTGIVVDIYDSYDEALEIAIRRGYQPEWVSITEI